MRWRNEPCPCCGQEAEWHCAPVAAAEDAPAGLGRRGLLAAALGLAGAAIATPGLAQGMARRISINRSHTNESFSGVYFQNGRYERDALRQLDWLLRDPAMAEATPMDPRLFDVLSTVAERLEANEPFEVISAYRAPETNASNARRSRRVSRVSLHMSGMAADVRLPGRNPSGVARSAAAMQLGGVGLYRSGFVHLDCGPARRW